MSIINRYYHTILVIIFCYNLYAIEHNCLGGTDILLNVISNADNLKDFNSYISILSSSSKRLKEIFYDKNNIKLILFNYYKQHGLIKSWDLCEFIHLNRVLFNIAYKLKHKSIINTLLLVDVEAICLNKENKFPYELDLNIEILNFINKINNLFTKYKQDYLLLDVSFVFADHSIESNLLNSFSKELNNYANNLIFKINFLKKLGVEFDQVNHFEEYSDIIKQKITLSAYMNKAQLCYNETINAIFCILYKK